MGDTIICYTSYKNRKSFAKGYHTIEEFLKAHPRKKVNFYFSDFLKADLEFKWDEKEKDYKYIPLDVKTKFNCKCLIIGHNSSWYLGFVSKEDFNKKHPKIYPLYILDVSQAEVIRSWNLWKC